MEELHAVWANVTRRMQVAVQGLYKQKQNVVTRPLSTFLADLCNKYKSDMSDKNVYDCYMSIQHNSIVILKRIIYLQNSVFQYHVFQTLRVLKTILPAGLNFAK